MYIYIIYTYYPSNNKSKKTETQKKNQKKLEKTVTLRCSVVVSIRGTWYTSHLNPKKTQKFHPEKNSLYFWKWNFLALIFSQKKTFFILPEIGSCTFQPKLKE